jgi:phosphatidylserine decarboxylase
LQQKKDTMKIHREGHSLIIASFLLCGFTGLLTKLFLPALYLPLMILTTALLLIILQFFRHPNRPIPQANEQLVYAPADGKVVVVEKTLESEYFKDQRWMISVFMSPINVHVNRNPVSGKIVYNQYHPGKYLVAWHPKSSTENERQTLVIAGVHGEVLLRQIAGALARRIKNYVSVGQQVRQGDEFGFIKFGSRVDIFLPTDAEPLVKIGDVVKGNLSVLARLPQG